MVGVYEMKYNEAKRQLQHALKHQQTISIPKLNEILQSMNFSLEGAQDEETQYLKGEIKKLRKELRKNRRGKA